LKFTFVNFGRNGFIKLAAEVAVVDVAQLGGEALHVGGQRVGVGVVRVAILRSSNSGEKFFGQIFIVKFRTNLTGKRSNENERKSK
jgi:hypothetical protein